MLAQESGSPSSSFCFATSSHAVALEKCSASSNHKENVLDDLQRPFQLFPSVIPFFCMWRGTHFASEDHYVWRELLLHDPGLEFILLTDFEMLQLGLYSFFFFWPKTFYEKQLPAGPNTIYSACLGKLWNSGFFIKLLLELGAIMVQQKEWVFSRMIPTGKFVVDKQTVLSMSCLQKDVSVRGCQPADNWPPHLL